MPTDSSRQNLTRAEAAGRSAKIRVEHYDVALDLRAAADPAATGYPTQSMITFDCAEPGAETFLDFIGVVHFVVLNGTALEAAQVADGARIRLPDLRARNQVTVSGTALYSRSGEGMHRFVDPADGETYLYTQYEPADARRVFANFEQPDLKASFGFSVIAPSRWLVASNGAETARTEVPGPGPEQLSRRDFAPTQRISTYITSVLAGPYHYETGHWSRTLAGGTVLQVPLGAACRASLAPYFDAAAIFEVTRRGLDFFHDLFDYPYPFGKYDQAFVPEYNLGAMENPGLVTFTEKYVHRSRATEAQYQARANTILHEMAHMWFGDLVTMAWWDDLWLKESFADFMGTLAVAEATEWTTAWVTFANRRKAWAYVQDQLPSTHPIVADIRDLEAAKQNFDGITYAKGASVLKQLVAFVGRDAFMAAARKYFRDHAYGNTTLADLLAALETASGRELAGWSRQWLQTAGVPTLELEVQYDGAGHDGGTVTAAAVRQTAVDPATGTEALKPHTLQLGVYNFSPAGDLVRERSLALDVDGALTPVPELTGLARPALLLLNDEDLSYAKIRFDEHSLATLLGSLDRLTDPLARATCWSALWNSTRDGVLSAGQFVDAVRQFAASVSEVGVLAMLLEEAGTAVERFCAPQNRGGLRGRLFDAVVHRLGAAAAGSDHQLAWARAAAALARTSPRHAPLLRGLLDGSEVPAGLAVDAELRWQLWQGLAAQGLATAAELDAELARDNSAAGRTGYTTAFNALPDPAIKASAWETAVHTDVLSNELLSATIEGFCAGPRELIDGFRPDYWASLTTVWGTKSIEIAGRIVRGLYPLDQDFTGGDPAGHPVVLESDAWLADNTEAPTALRRIIIEQRDHLLRALRAQASPGGVPPTL